MKKISAESWVKFISKLKAVDDEAIRQIEQYVGSFKGGFEFSNEDHMKALIDCAYGVSSKYGEATAALACQMYDEVGLASGKFLEPAVPANTPTYGEVVGAVKGAAKHSQTAKSVSGAVGKLVKRVGADTTLKNALRDGAQFAWIPHGDTCSFCITLASKGWQNASKKALKNGHAEHIHANCDCTYAVRFDENTTVAGYDPQKYLDMYNSAEGKTAKEKARSFRRIRYQENKDKINAQKRAAYAEKKNTEKGYLSISARIGTNEVDMNYIRSKEYRAKFDKLSNDQELNELLYENAVTILDSNKGTDTETTMIFSGTRTIINKKGKKNALDVSLSPGQIGIVKSKKNLVGMHNHPSNLPPTGADFVAAGSRRYNFGVIVTHDGRLYKYSAGNKPFAAQGFDNTVDKYLDKEYNLSTQEAFEKALRDYKERFGISWQLVE